MLLMKVLNTHVTCFKYEYKKNVIKPSKYNEEVFTREVIHVKRVASLNGYARAVITHCQAKIQEWLCRHKQII